MVNLGSKMELVHSCNGISSANHCRSLAVRNGLCNFKRSVCESIEFEHADRPVPHDALSILDGILDLCNCLGTNVHSDKIGRNIDAVNGDRSSSLCKLLCADMIHRKNDLH